jgi:hypothetical protein
VPSGGLPLPSVGAERKSTSVAVGLENTLNGLAHSGLVTGPASADLSAATTRSTPT